MYGETRYSPVVLGTKIVVCGTAAVKFFNLSFATIVGELEVVCALLCENASDAARSTTANEANFLMEVSRLEGLRGGPHSSALATSISMGLSKA